LATGLGPAAAASAQAPGALASSTGCITTLPVVATVPSSFTTSYRRVLPVRVTTRGPLVRRLRVSLYTFSGDLLGRGFRRKPLGGSGVVRVRLRFRLQPGAYTLYSEGEPNRDPSCGPKHGSRVVRFRGCTTDLPVSIPEPPGGVAADYGGFLSFDLASRGPLIRQLDVTVSAFDGTLYGRTRLSALFGTVTVHVPLWQELVPGDYTVTVLGVISSEPGSCGLSGMEQTLTFT
jgi:hypothetical protein